MQFWALGWEDPLEEDIATHSSILSFSFHFTYSFMLQYSCLENPHGQKEAWRATVHRVAQSWTWLKRLSSRKSIQTDFCKRDIYWNGHMVEKSRNVSGVPSLRNLIPVDLRWSWYNNDKNKYIINVMHLNHPETISPSPPAVENRLPWNWFQVPERLTSTTKTAEMFSLPCFLVALRMAALFSWTGFVWMAETCPWEQLWLTSAQHQCRGWLYFLKSWNFFNYKERL